MGCIDDHHIDFRRDQSLRAGTSPSVPGTDSGSDPQAAPLVLSGEWEFLTAFSISFHRH